jgi:hypothetical protein
MAEDWISQAAQLGGSIPGWSALVAALALALKLGRHIGVYDKTQENQATVNGRLDAAIGKLDADLVGHKARTDERFETHAQALTDTRLTLAKLPDRDEIGRLFADLRADINRRGGA